MGLAAYVRPQALLLVPLAMVPSLCHVAPARQRLRDATLDVAVAGGVALIETDTRDVQDTVVVILGLDDVVSDDVRETDGAASAWPPSW